MDRLQQASIRHGGRVTLDTAGGRLGRLPAGRTASTEAGTVHAAESEATGVPGGSVAAARSRRR